MTAPLHIISVNQDSGISPTRKKGAAVHLQAMRAAFRQLGAVVWDVDERDGSKLREKLQRINGRQAVQLIYERYALGRSAAARFAQEQGIPLALEVNAPLADEQQRWRGQQESDDDRDEDAVVFGSAGFIAAVSSQVASYAEKRGGRPESIHLCPNGIDSALFKPYSKAGNKARLMLPGESFVLGFHGRERPWHGFDMLVEVAQALLGSSVPVHLLVIGEGDFKALSRLPKGTYTRLPWMEHAQIPACISAFDVLPLTYSQDAPCYFSPLKLMESMACAVVPVVPDLGDLPSIVSHLHNGWVYEAGKHEALVKALLALFNDPALKSRMADAAVESARSNGWDRIAGKVLDHFGLEHFGLEHDGVAAPVRVAGAPGAGDGH